MTKSFWRVTVSTALVITCCGCPPSGSSRDKEPSPTTETTASQGAPAKLLERPTGPDPSLPSLKARQRATTRRSGGVRDINFDDLEFPIERDADFDPAMLTDSIRELEGKTVLLRGYILASTIFKQTGIQEFVLVRDNQECCFGPGAYLYHNAQIEMVPPRTTNFSIRPVTVRGILSIRPWSADGKTYSIFHIAAEQVE